MSGISRIGKVFDGGRGTITVPNTLGKGLRNKRSIKSPKAQLAMQLKYELLAEKRRNKWNNHGQS